MLLFNGNLLIFPQICRMLFFSIKCLFTPNSIFHTNFNIFVPVYLASHLYFVKTCYVRHLCCFVQILPKNLPKCIKEQNTDNIYTRSVSSIKKHKYDKHNTSIIMLKQISGISNVIAEGLLTQYGSIKILIENINNLQNIKIKNRKINKNTIKNIIEIFS